MNIPPKYLPCTGVAGSTEPIKFFAWKNVMGYISYELPSAYCINDYEEELSKVIQNSVYYHNLPWTYQKNKEFIIKAVKQNKKVFLQLNSDLQQDPDIYKLLDI
jgi:hypothetical protein